MNIIPCTSELCELPQHPIGSPARHIRITSGPDELYRVAVLWTEDALDSALVLLSHGDDVIELTGRDAAALARLLAAGGLWSPAFGGGGTAALATDLGAAAEVLALVDPNGEPPMFGSHVLTLFVDHAIGEFFSREDEEARA